MSNAGEAVTAETFEPGLLWDYRLPPDGTEYLEAKLNVSIGFSKIDKKRIGYVEGEINKFTKVKDDFFRDLVRNKWEFVYETVTEKNGL